MKGRIFFEKGTASSGDIRRTVNWGGSGAIFFGGAKREGAEEREVLGRSFLKESTNEKNTGKGLTF